MPELSKKEKNVVNSVSFRKMTFSSKMFRFAEKIGLFSMIGSVLYPLVSLLVFVPIVLSLVEFHSKFLKSLNCQVKSRLIFVINKILVLFMSPTIL